MLLSILLLLFGSLQSHAHKNCRYQSFENKAVVQCAQLEIESKNFDQNNRLITFRFYDGFHLNLTYLKTQAGPMVFLQTKLGNRKMAILSNQDIQNMNEAIHILRLQLSPSDFKVFRFFTNLPAHENLEPLIIASNEVPWPTNRYSDSKDSAGNRASYQMICELVGQKNLGYFKYKQKWQVREAVVGDPKTECYGRCGFGCGWGYDHTYTQECFDHDICHRLTGENLGVCTLSFLQAMRGFLFAPSCEGL